MDWPDFVGADSTLALAAMVGRKIQFNFFYECSVPTIYWGRFPG